MSSQPRTPAQIVVRIGSGVVLVAAIALVMYGVVRAAWLCDDIYITLRTIDNWVNGFGLRWNIDERVQTFTHPLWLFVLSLPYYFTREPYYTTLAVSFVMTLATLAVLSLLAARRPVDAIVGVLVAGASHAFIDYSTSGLENPLSNLLVVVYVWLLLRAERGPRRLQLTTFVASLLVLNRADYVLVVAPSLLYELYAQQSRRALADVCIGVIPVVAWELFSFVYYGSLVPNTAYAKLNHGFGRAVLWHHGWTWASYTMRHDWPTAITVGGAVVVALWRRSLRELTCVAGALIYVCYTISIGGDFMSGRFWLTPFMLALAYLVSCGVPATRIGLAAVLVSTIWLPLRTTAYGANPRTSGAYETGVWDERHSYFDTMGLVNVGWHARGPLHPWARWGLAEGREVSVTERSAVGMHGYYGGPHLHIIDDLALADPLLARLRPAPQSDLWVGHLLRLVPVGYKQTIRDHRNELEDPDLHRFYDHLSLVIRGPIWSPKRLWQAFRLVTGGYNKLLQGYEARAANARKTVDRFAFFADPNKDPLFCDTCLTFYESGEIVAPRPLVGASRCAMLAVHRRYRVELLRGDKLEGDVFIGDNADSDSWSSFGFDVPRNATVDGFDRVRLVALHGKSPFTTGGIECSVTPDREP